MFDNLIESKPKKSRSTGQMLVSVLFHAGLVLLLIKVTKGAAETVKEILADTTMVFLEPPKETPPPPDQPPPDAVVAANPPPQGFQTVVPPDVIPTEIPPVDLTQKFDARDFSGKGVEGGIAAGVIGGTGPVDPSAQVFLEAQVDDPPTLISAGPQRYPEMLKAAGIAGRVVVQFVVDTTGHPDPASIKIISTPHQAFGPATRELVSKSLFRPGKVRGQAVAVLVQQAINFTP
ncbi:MAG TPA: energy transducer TonB [Gemmatimonadales bacterium]|nr:energy transducer TonB [Gemmatimonadales bacterium]